MAFPLDLDGAPRLRRCIVPERTPVGSPDEEHIASGRTERARSHRFLRGLCEEWRKNDSDVRDGLRWTGRMAYLDDPYDFAVSLAHVEDTEIPAHGKRGDFVRVHPDVADLLVRDAFVERPRRHVLLRAGVPCNVR